MALGLGAACFGSIPYFAKAGFAAGISPGAAVFLRYILPAVLLAPYLPQALKSGPSSRQYVLFGMIMGLGAWSYFYALSELPVYLAASLFFSYPALLVILRGIGGARLRNSDWLTLGLVLCALLIIIALTPLPDVDLTAVAIGLIGPLSYGGLQLVSRRTPSYLPSLAIAACIFSGALVMAVPFALMELTLWQGAGTAPMVMPILGLALIAGLLPQFLLAFGSSDRSGRKTAYTTGFIEFGLAILTGYLSSPNRWGSGKRLALPFCLAHFT